MQERTIVLEATGVHWASSRSVIESTLRRQRGVIGVDGNPVSRTAKVTHDTELTSPSQLRQWSSNVGTTVRVSRYSRTSAVLRTTFRRQNRRRWSTRRTVDLAARATLHEAGIEVAMLTGDNDATAKGIASLLKYETVIALPIAAGVFNPGFGLMLSLEIAAVSKSGSSVIVAVNALLFKRLRLPAA